MQRVKISIINVSGKAIAFSNHQIKEVVDDRTGSCISP